MLVIVLGFLLFNTNAIFSQRRTALPSSSSLTITTEPNAIVWIDEIRRGVTDASGRLELKKFQRAVTWCESGRADFREVTTSLLAGRRSMAVKLVRTTDQAELAFQQAEDAREKARDDAARAKGCRTLSGDLKLRPAFPAAHVGLARVLLDLNQYQAALDEIEAARRTRPSTRKPPRSKAASIAKLPSPTTPFSRFAERFARRAGFSRKRMWVWRECWKRRDNIEKRSLEFRKAIDQLSDSEPVIYQLLGAAYEKQQKYKEAVAAYEKYLALAPNGSLAPAIRSIIDQLRRDAAGQEIIP